MPSGSLGKMYDRKHLHTLSKALTAVFWEWQLYKVPSDTNVDSHCVIPNAIATMRLCHCHMNDSNKNGPGNSTLPLQLKFMDINCLLKAMEMLYRTGLREKTIDHLTKQTQASHMQRLRDYITSHREAKLKLAVTNTLSGEVFNTTRSQNVDVPIGSVGNFRRQMWRNKQ